jgi:hypothetical protein
MFDDQIICDEGFTNTKRNDHVIGFQLECRIPFYRALPLSCIEAVALKIDGETVATSDISFILRNNIFKIEELTELIDTWWGFTEKAIIFVHKEGGLEPKTHEIDLSFHIRWPILIPSDGEERANYDNSRQVKNLRIA